MKVTSLFKYLKPYTAKSIIGALFKLFEAILELFMPLLLAKVIDNGIATSDKPYIYKMSFILIGIVFLGLCCALVCQYLASKVSQGYGTALRNTMFKKVLSLSKSQADALSSPSLINRVTVDVNNIQHFVAMLIRLVIRAPFLCIGGTIMSFIINPKLALIVLVILPVFIFILYVIMKHTLPLHINAQEKLDKLTLVIRENINGVRVVKAFSGEEKEKDRFSKSAGEYSDAVYKVSKIGLLLNPFTMLIMNAAIISVIYISGWQINSGYGISTGEIVAFINYLNQILAALVVVSNLVIMFSKTYASSKRICEVLELKDDIIQGTEDIDLSASRAVVFEHVSFSYGGEVNELNDISFVINKGDKIGIIGGTGSGKTTVVNLIARFYDTGTGKITLFGKNIKDIKTDALRSAVSIVPQKTQLINGTLKDNIIFGREYDSKKFERACDISRATEFISNKQNKENTIIGEGGGGLSGGQKQRISIARAIYKDSPILIFDDSSSALDYKTDMLLRNQIKTKLSDKTVITISQRVNSIKDCSGIIVLSNGRMVGFDSHENLCRSCEEYREICQSQGVEYER